MLPAGTIDRVDWNEEKVYVDRTKDQIKDSPEFDDSMMYDNNTADRDRLGTYGGDTYDRGTFRRQHQPGSARGDPRGGHRHLRRTPKLLTTDAMRASDFVITMGCGDACPYFAGTRYLEWQFDGAAGHGVEAVRTMRDAISRRVTPSSTS